MMPTSRASGPIFQPTNVTMPMVASAQNAISADSSTIRRPNPRRRGVGPAVATPGGGAMAPSLSGPRRAVLGRSCAAGGDMCTHAFLTMKVICEQSSGMLRLGVVSLVATLAGAIGLAGCASEAADERPQRGRRVLPAAVRGRAGGRRPGERDQPRPARRRAARPGAEPAAGGQHRRRRPGALPGRVPAGSSTRRSAQEARRRRRSTLGHRADRAHGRARQLATRTAATDPHFWLDPTRLATVADAVGRASGRGRPGRGGAATGARRRLAAHPSWPSWTGSTPDGAGRLPAARDRRQPRGVRLPGRTGTTWRRSAITGLSPDVEPTPQRLAEVAAAGPAARRHHDLLRDAGQPAGGRGHRGRGRAPRPPCSIRSKGCRPGSPDDYLSVMRTNLDSAQPARWAARDRTGGRRLRDGRGQLRRPPGSARHRT